MVFTAWTFCMMLSVLSLSALERTISKDLYILRTLIDRLYLKSSMKFQPEYFMPSTPHTHIPASLGSSHVGLPSLISVQIFESDVGVREVPLRLISWLFLQRTRVWFPAFTWWLTPVTPVPRNPVRSYGLCRHQIHQWYPDIHGGKIATQYIKMK